MNVNNHGLTIEQWQTLLEGAGWQPVVTRALREVATSSAADAADRLSALALLSDAIVLGLLPSDFSYPELMRDVLLEIAAGCRRPWFSGRARARLRDQLTGARCLVQTAQNLRAGASLAESPAAMLS